jgi:hypothetical protein
MEPHAVFRTAKAVSSAMPSEARWGWRASSPPAPSPPSVPGAQRSPGSLFRRRGVLLRVVLKAYVLLRARIPGGFTLLALFGHSARDGDGDPSDRDGIKVTGPEDWAY